MKPIKDIYTFYRQEAEHAEENRLKVQQRINRISLLRVALFLGGTAAVIHFGTQQYQWAVTAAIVTFIPFLWLMKQHNRLFIRKEYLEKEAMLNRQELRCLDYDFAAFDDGHESIDPMHNYSFDLDLFGPHSFFQYINRTCTVPGKAKLQQWLKHPLLDKQAIERRQEAVKKLTGNRAFCHRFRILGMMHKGAAADEQEIKWWTESPDHFSSKRWMRLLPVAAASINGCCLIGAQCGLLPYSLWGMVFTAFIMTGFIFTNRVTRLQQVYGKKLRILSTYTALLHHIEGLQASCPAIQSLKQRTEGNGCEIPNAAATIKRLSKLMNQLDQRNNVFMYMLLNGSFFWEINLMMRIERWKSTYGLFLPQWIDAVGEMDALCTLGTFAYNHPDYTYPTITDKPFTLQGRQMGHPLIPRNRCVRNDIRMRQRPQFVIITGANMAGKSTYLRTVGINYVMACCGMPVCAEELTLYPEQLITSLRTSDSLTGNESYFFAELKRLKYIINELKSGKECFIILDEILKGTNSVDKQNGSPALVRQLIELQTCGIIATHDLLLGSLAERYPHEVENFCFDADIIQDELYFSYRMKSGLAKNMNACFLMKKMGIAITD